ncbi:MAG: hypothetical protein LLG14_00775 [Nocardiaceae bacterium]|nr:hypothetical protein [Nocardiaceae bacterium]
MIDGLVTLRDEIGAYYRGAGQPNVLREAFRQAWLFVPLTDDEDVYLGSMGGVHWLCAFSTEAEMDKYCAGRTDMSSGRFITVPGWRLLNAGGNPTCVMVDIKGEFPMSFPPAPTVI